MIPNNSTSLSCSSSNNLKQVIIPTSDDIVRQTRCNNQSTSEINTSFSDAEAESIKRTSSITAKPAANVVSKPNFDLHWLQKNISIQTEPSLSNGDWVSNVRGLFFENIGTQTIENVTFESSTETDSTFCQTDLSNLSSADNLQTLWGQNCYTNYANQPLTCDAQNQTVSDINGSVSAVRNELSKNNLSTQVYSSDVNASIETQTETSVNSHCAQTQTFQPNAFHEQSNAVSSVSALDVFLNDIETQTDFFLPTPAESSNAFVHSYTQTPGNDFLSDILNLTS